MSRNAGDGGAVRRLAPVVHAGLDERRAVVLPGEGVVARMPGLVVAVRPGSADVAVQSRLLKICEKAVGDGRDAPGTRLAYELAAWLSGQGRDQSDEDALPEFGVVAEATHGLVVFLRGRAWLSAPGPGGVSLSGEESATWLDRLLDRPPGPLVLHLGPTPANPGSGAEWWNLAAGVVPGAGVVLHPMTVPGDREVLGAPRGSGALRRLARVRDPEATGRAEPIVEPIAATNGEPTSPREARDLSAPLPLPAQRDSRRSAGSRESREALAVGEVQGVLCAREHLNDPRSGFCVVCGIRMDQRSGPLAKGPRPPLGLLVLDDGTTVLVDSGYVVGRDPHQHEGVLSGTMRPLELDDAEGTLSRVHAEIVLHGWDAFVVDRNSANGTYVSRRDSDEWTALPPDEPERLVRGTRIQVGGRVLVFESHHGLR